MGKNLNFFDFSNLAVFITRIFPRMLRCIPIILLIFAVPGLLCAQEEVAAQNHAVLKAIPNPGTSSLTTSNSKSSYEKPSKHPTHGSFEINDYYAMRVYKGRLLEGGFLEDDRGKFFNIAWPPVVSNRIEQALRDNVELSVELRGKLHYHQPDYRSIIGAKYTLHEPEIITCEENPMQLFVPRADIEFPPDSQIVTIKGTALRDLGAPGTAAFLMLENNAIRLTRPWSDTMRELIYRIQNSYRKNTVLELEGFYLPNTDARTGLRQFVVIGINKAEMKKFVDCPLIRRSTSEGLPIVTEYLQAESMIGAPVMLEGNFKLKPGFPVSLTLRHYREDRTIPINFPPGTVNPTQPVNYRARISGTIGPGPSLENPTIEMLQEIK